MEKGNEKRVLRVELDDDVKKVSITGLGSDEKVVMRQELDEEDLNLVTGGRPGEEIDVGFSCIEHGAGCEFDGRAVEMKYNVAGCRLLSCLGDNS